MWTLVKTSIQMLACIILWCKADEIGNKDYTLISYTSWSSGARASSRSRNSRNWTSVDCTSRVSSNHFVLPNFNHTQSSSYSNPSCSGRSSRTHSSTVVDVVTRVYSDNNIPSRGNPFQFSRNVDPLKNVQFRRWTVMQKLSWLTNQAMNICSYMSFWCCQAVKIWSICMYHYTYTRSSGVWISISSSSIVDVVSSVDNPNSRWSNSNLYGFSSNVLPVPSSPSEYVPVSVDSPNMTSVTYIQLKSLSLIFDNFVHEVVEYWWMSSVYLLPEYFSFEVKLAALFVPTMT